MTQTIDTFASSVRKHSLRLAVFTLGVALVLTVVDALTTNRIAEQQLQAQRAALADVLPASLHDNDLLDTAFDLQPDDSGFTQTGLLGLSTPRTGYVAKMAGTTSGVILPLETADGYSGTIVLMIGINADGAITGVRVVQHAETPGLVDSIDAALSPWIHSFNNRSLPNTPPVLWQVKKDGGDFDQFVGATITPRAVVASVHNALLFFDANRERLLAGPTP